MQKRPKLIPGYFVTPRNITVQILFTSLFAYVFINIYRPFGAGTWYQVTWYEFSFFSGLLVLAGMLVVLISRLLMFKIKKSKPITVRYYLLMVAGEILLMALLYAVIEITALNDPRPFWELWFIALQNTALILLIPYLISILFFAWREKTISFNNLLRQHTNKDQFIPFRDENNVLRYSVKFDDLLYIQSSDNYVVIHYLLDGRGESILVRNNLKYFEKALENFSLLRCHRSYMVNVRHIKMVQKEGNNLRLLLDTANHETIPVSRSYAQTVSKFFNQ
jgi:hypothetical protein